MKTAMIRYGKYKNVVENNGRQKDQLALQLGYTEVNKEQQHFGFC